MARFEGLRRIAGDTGSRRLLIPIVLVLIVIACWFLFFRTPPDVTASQLRPVPSQMPTTQGGNVVSSQYRQALNEADSQRAEEARRRGESAVPTIIAQPRQEIQNPPDFDRNGPRLPASIPPRQEPVMVSRPLQVAQPLPPPPAVRASNEQTTQNLSRSMGMMADEKLPGAGVQYFNDGKLTSDQVANADRQMPSILAAMNGAQIVDALKPAPGTVLYGEMVSEANSDAPGPVLAKVLQGPLAGATLIGQFKKGEDSLVIDFKKMTIVKKEGGRETYKTVEIEAYAVDTDKLGTAMATDVDRHLLQKVAVAASTSFIQGMGNAVAQSGTTITRDVTGTTVAYPQLDTKQQLLVAGGQTAGQVGQILNREFGNKPTTIKVRSGTPIGVLFL